VRARRIGNAGKGKVSRARWAHLSSALQRVVGLAEIITRLAALLERAAGPSHARHSTNSVDCGSEFAHSTSGPTLPVCEGT
jgi:hypothetical protein